MDRNVLREATPHNLDVSGAALAPLISGKQQFVPVVEHQIGANQERRSRDPVRSRAYCVNGSGSILRLTRPP